MVGIMFPIIFVAVIIMYLSGMYDFMDLIKYLKEFNIIYYIILLPFGLGFLAVILWYRKPKEH